MAAGRSQLPSCRQHHSVVRARHRSDINSPSAAASAKTSAVNQQTFVIVTIKSLMIADCMVAPAMCQRIDCFCFIAYNLMAPPPGIWKRPSGRPHITWLNTVKCDLRAYNLTLNEAVDLDQNCPLWRLMSTYGATHS